MPQHVTMTLNEFRLLHAIVGMFIILIVVSVLIALKGGRRRNRPSRLQSTTRQKRRTSALATRIGQRLNRGGRSAIGVLFWSIAYPLLYPLALFVASRRGALVEASLDSLRDMLSAHNHRCGHPVCVPFLFWPQWFARCRACKKWVQLQEMPSIDGTHVDLMIVRGSLESEPCPRRYIPISPHPTTAPPVPSAPAARPTSPSTSQQQVDQGTAKTA